MKKAKRQSYKENKHFTLILIPHTGDMHSYSISMPKWMAYCVGLFLFAVFASSIIYSATLTRKLFSYDFLKERTRQQKTEIHNFSTKSVELQEQINTLARREAEVRKLLGLKPLDLTLVPKIKLPNLPISVDLDTVKRQLNSVDLKLKYRNKSLDNLIDNIKNYRARFDATPSIWPVKGEITSGFGYRVFPWGGFHRAVDITTFFGTPIKATASGVVSFAGWESGYGKMVKIDHGYDLSTLYGHCSKLLVEEGQSVVKGQIIALVGSTGLSTGCHVHYEVRKFDVAINPTKFLELDLLTANKLW